MRTQGIVLREIRYKDSSKILTIYTREHGKISAMARGAYKARSGMTANTQLFSYNEYEMYKGKQFYYLNQAHMIDSFYSIREKMERISYGYYMLEMIDKSLEEDQRSEKIFLLLHRGLEILSELEEGFLKFIVGYELKFVSFLGYRPVIDKCVLCEGRIDSKSKFSIRNGGIICSNCFHQDHLARNIDRNIYNAINSFLYTKLEDVGQIEITHNSLYKLHNILVEYLLHNIDRKKFNSLTWIDCYKG